MLMDLSLFLYSFRRQLFVFRWEKNELFIQMKMDTPDQHLFPAIMALFVGTTIVVFSHIFMTRNDIEPQTPTQPRNTWWDMGKYKSD